MLFGICADFNNAKLARAAGFDYCEATVTNLLTPFESDAGFSANLCAWQGIGLPITTCNVLMAGDLKIVGDQNDPAALRQYMTLIAARAQIAGVEKLVFGSGAARKVPDGFPYDAAENQLLEFVKSSAEICAGRGVQFGVETLNSGETNMLNTLRQALDFFTKLDGVPVGLTLDFYHWSREPAPDGADIIEVGPRILHTHIATAAKRLAPGLEDCDFNGFFSALHAARYDRTMSLECGWSDGDQPGGDASLQALMERALAVLRGL